MKYFVLAGSLSFATLATAVDYQQVFETDKTATEIVNASRTAITATSASVAGNTLTVQAKVDCLTGWPFKVAMPVYGNTIIEAKDKKYRITFDNFKAESGYSLKELNNGLTEACQTSFKEYALQLSSKINNWSDF